MGGQAGGFSSQEDAEEGSIVFGGENPGERLSERWNRLDHILLQGYECETVRQVYSPLKIDATPARLDFKIAC